VSDFRFNVAMRDGDPESITIFSGGRSPLIGTPDNPGFQRVLDLVKGTDTTYDMLASALSPAIAVGTAFARLSERVAVRGGQVYFDNDRVDNALTKAIATFHASGATEYQALVNFMEKVMQNPEPHSREQLYEWLQRWHFGIALDGDIIAYKGLKHSGRDADQEAWESQSRGHAIVNGKPFDGNIPGFPGAIIEMPRSEVVHDPTIACSTGLHVGNWSYASSFATVTVRVKVNPRDVCSVPNDSEWAKVRCCRYQLLGKVTEQDKDVLFVPEVYKTLCASALTPAEHVLPEEEPHGGGVQRTRKPRAAKSTSKKAPIKGKGKAARTVRPHGYVREDNRKTTEKRAIVPSTGRPLFYEDMKVADLRTVPFNELRWVAKEWGIKLAASPTKQALVDAIAKKAAGKRRAKNKTYTPTSR
jgi:hypothetical protein